MELIAQKREKFGKANKSLRRSELIPAELYGHGIENLHLAVHAKEFLKIFKEAGENRIVNLVVNKEKRPALIHDVKKDYLTGSVMHVDFYQVKLDEKIKARIPLEFTGDAPAVKEKGGFLNKTVSEIEVEALPGNLPSNFILNLAALDDLNKSLYAKDLKIPAGVKIFLDPETVLVTITPPLKEEEKVEQPVDVTAVKVETEEKKAERVAEKTKEETK